MAGEGSLQVVVDRVGSPSSAADALASASASASSKPSLQVIVLVSRLFSRLLLVWSPRITFHRITYANPNIFAISAFFSSSPHKGFFPPTSPTPHS